LVACHLTNKYACLRTVAGSVCNSWASCYVLLLWNSFCVFYK